MTVEQSVTFSDQPAPTTSRRLARAALRVGWKLAFPIAGFVVIVGAWQLIVTWTHTKSYIFPKPSEVVSSTLNQPGLLWTAVLITLKTAAAGLGLAIGVGVAVGVFLGISPLLQRSVFPYAVVLQTTPVVAIAPIVVIVLGPNLGSIVMIVFLISFFPMLSGTLVGLNSVDPDLRGVFRLYRSTRLKTLLKLRLPNAIPYIVSGLKVASGLSIIGAIVGEYVAGVGGAQGGLGYLLVIEAQQLNTAFLVATALAGSVMGLLFYGVVSIVARLLTAWQDPGAAREVRGGLATQVGG
jgi:NitT/TauT family transport system permease protein